MGEIMKKMIRKWAVLIACVLCTMLGAGKMTASAGDTIYNGVSIGDIDVSGMTAEQAKAAVEQYIEKLKTSEISLVVVQGEKVPVVLGDFNPVWSNPEVVEEAMNLVSKGNVIARYKAKKDIAYHGVSLDLEILFDESKITDFIKKECAVYNCEATNASLSRKNGEFVITEGKPGVAVNVAESTELLKSSLLASYSSGAEEIKLVVQETQPEGNSEELKQIKDILGTFTTSFKSSNSNRSANVSNGCRLIDGTILYPGEEFSAYDAVKPFTEENGFYLAGSYMNGQVVDSLGGGICQVSTTLYNAVLRAELEVTERYPHSMVVSYVDKSADAAIAESSGKDFKFVNNTEHPIYIEGITEDKQLTFNIYGVEYRPENRTVKYVSEILSETVPEVENITPDPGQGVGYITVSSAHIGYKAKLWKVVYVDGEEVSREQVNSSSYKATPRAAVVGVNTADPNRYNQIMAAIASGSIDTCKAVAAALLEQEKAAAAAAQNPQPQENAVAETPEI